MVNLETGLWLLERGPRKTAVPDGMWQWALELTFDRGTIFVLEESSVCVHLGRKVF